jgi:hypothetical protein
MFVVGRPGFEPGRDFVLSEKGVPDFHYPPPHIDSVRSVPKGWHGRRESTCPDHFRHFPNCSGASGLTRTGNPELRRFVLCPVELQTHVWCRLHDSNV